MVKYISPIDKHIHLRGDEYADFNFTDLAFRDANVIGAVAVIDKPNYKINEKYPIDEETITTRIENMRPFVERYGVLYATNIVATSDMSQVRNAVGTIHSMKRFVKGFKLFTCHTTSTEEIEIIDPIDQRKFWKTIAEARYKGNVDIHLEDQSKFGPRPFDPSNPISHSLYQNPEAELAQFETQFYFARDAGFEGLFVSLHTSNPAVIRFGKRLVQKYNPRFEIKFEVIWNHLLLNTDAYKIHGNFVKRNPPLRSSEMQEGLMDETLAGNVDYIATDHAPHPTERKTDSLKPASGDPAELIYPFGIGELRRKGINEKLLEDILFHNANKDYFDGNLIPRTVDVEYRPELWADYGHNSFSHIDGSN